MPQEDLSKLKIDKSAKKSATTSRRKKPFIIAALVILLIIGAVLYRLGVIAPTRR